MKSLKQFVDEEEERGHYHFTKEACVEDLQTTSDAFTAAATRLIKKNRLISPWRGFYVILRPEDRAAGAPEPQRWIDPMMKYLDLDYRISLLTGAFYHGSTHQSPMVFQLIALKQLRSFSLGRYRIQFVYQKPEAFRSINQSDWLQPLKSDAGYSKLAGVELVLLDSVRYYHEVGGINSCAQIVHDIGGKASVRKLVMASNNYENSVVRRLGYLLNECGHERQSNALEPAVEHAKSTKPLDPSLKPLLPEFANEWPLDAHWKLQINTPLEIDQ
jgi:hypothetical protein